MPDACNVALPPCVPLNAPQLYPFVYHPMPFFGPSTPLCAPKSLPLLYPAMWRCAGCCRYPSHPSSFSHLADHAPHSYKFSLFLSLSLHLFIYIFFYLFHVQVRVDVEFFSNAVLMMMFSWWAKCSPIRENGTLHTSLISCQHCTTASTLLMALTIIMYTPYVKDTSVCILKIYSSYIRLVVPLCFFFNE